MNISPKVQKLLQFVDYLSGNTNENDQIKILINIKTLCDSISLDELKYCSPNISFSNLFNCLDTSDESESSKTTT